jgi:sugar diacid utilization regulator
MSAQLPANDDMFREFPDEVREILRAFIEVAVRATSPDVDGLLELVANRICELLSVKRCSVYLKADDGLLHGRIGHFTDRAFDEDIKTRIAGRPADHFTHEILDTMAPVLVRDAPNDPRTIRETMRRWQVKDVLGVPLLFDGEVIGVTYLDNADEPREFTSSDIEIAQIFAALASLAIRQARLCEQISERALVIDHQKQVLERLAQIHASLTRSVLSGADVPAILDLVATLVHKPVLFYTSSFELSGWSAGEGNPKDHPPKLPPDARQLPWVRRSIDALTVDRPSVILPASPESGLAFRRLICQLVIGDRVAGYLEIVEVGMQISIVDVKVAEHAATVLSLEMLSQQRQVAAEGQAREEFLNDLLFGMRDLDVLTRRAPVFGIDLDEPHVLVRVAHESGTSSLLPGPERRARMAAEVATRSGMPVSLSVTIPGADLFLVGPLEGTDLVTLRAVKAAVEGALGHRGAALGVRRAALSRVSRGATDLPVLHRELRSALELTERFGRTEGVVLTSELGLLRLFASEEQHEEVTRFALDLLGPVQALDTSTDGQLFPTLRAFLEAGGRVRLAAGSLGVHENTVRYRLGKVQSLTGIDFDDLDDLLNLRLALQVLDLSHA